MLKWKRWWRKNKMTVHLESQNNITPCEVAQPLYTQHIGSSRKEHVTSAKRMFLNTETMQTWILLRQKVKLWIDKIMKSFIQENSESTTTRQREASCSVCLRFPDPSSPSLPSSPSFLILPQSSPYLFTPSAFLFLVSFKVASGG